MTMQERGQDRDRASENGDAPADATGEETVGATGDAAPPTHHARGTSLKRASAWPTVLAILAFAWGGYSLLSAGCMMLMSPFYQWMVDAMGDQFGDAEREAMERMAEYWWYWIVYGVLGCALSVLLIVAGLGLLRRVQQGAALAKLWAVFSLLLLFIMTPLTFLLFEFPAFNTTGSSGTSNVGQTGGMIGGIIGTLFGFAISMGLPVFFLIWFSRARIKEEVKTWP